MNPPRGLCQCGCGKPTRLAPRTQKDRGHIKGQPMRFLHGHAGAQMNVRARTTPVPPPRRPRRAPRPGPPTPAEVYADQLTGLSELVIGAVHDEGQAAVLATIRAALALTPPPGIDPVTALVTVLAAQVDPDTTTSTRLGWVEDLDGSRSPALPRAAHPSRDRGAA